MIHTDVLIVGGSLVGLSAAAMLAHHNVKCLAVERHQGTAIHPRAGHFHLRTLEAFRAIGLEDAVRRASEEQFDPDGGISAVESLAGNEIAQYIANLNAGVEQYSPSRRLFMTQQSLEPLLREHAQALGAQLSYSTELVNFTQDDEGITATVRDLPSGKEDTIRAKYMIAADGNRSPVRNQLGIEMVGHGELSHSVTIYFKADCGRWLEGRNLGVIYVKNDKLRGFFRMVRSGEAGFLVVNTVGDVHRPGAHNIADAITPKLAEELVREGIGDAHVKITIEDIARWRAVADVAATFSSRRVFLAGDAAHTMPPTGGFGGNTGVQDMHNLCWKLALVLKGVAAPTLLDTYDTERRPVAALTVEQAYTRYVLRIHPERDRAGMQPLVDDLNMEIGYLYRSPAIAPVENDHDLVYEDPRTALGRPGSRAPHLLLTQNDNTFSVLDLASKHHALLVGPDGTNWANAAQHAAGTLGIPLDTYILTPQGVSPETIEQFTHRYQVSKSGAVLIRPDGFIAWKATSNQNAQEPFMKDVLSCIMGKG
ncbi:FAD-dependent monooxygenase [Pusillimonas sp. DMV24BSW_D]|uniref:FAD-dependent monooxygenase n=1 Tax=Neopusillimonas aestuarii TaxID=2716226 RepID=UPI00140948D5|nr:FAD-dependent monooxygenase [Pusillimonas sp. DMV24BSW_D]QIM48730.1 FAD-dependent monooxygenase [Pusillimonas sp. DMV24BSW_D]